MKIIQVNASYKPAFVYGGPTMSVSKLSEVLAARGINIEVLTTCANGTEELSVDANQTLLVDNVRVTYYKRLTKDHTHFSPNLYMGLIRKIKNTENTEGKIVLHIHTWWNLVSIISCLIGIIQKVPVVLSPRGTLSPYSFGNRNNLIKRLIHILISRPLLKRCHLHATSENEKIALLRLIKPKSIHVIPNLVDLSAQKEHDFSNPKSSGSINILFLSRIEKKKGIELLFSALESIDDDYRLTIAGSGDEHYITSLKKLSELLKISHKIKWVGHQHSDKKFIIMKEHDLLVLPSYDENFANVIIESLASGTAVLITENVGLSDYVQTNNFGWVCSFNKLDLREKLIQIIKDENQLLWIRKNAPQKIKEDFSDEAVSDKYIEMYMKVLTKSLNVNEPKP